jgi:hypothetical protein
MQSVWRDRNGFLVSTRTIPSARSAIVGPVRLRARRRCVSIVEEDSMYRSVIYASSLSRREARWRRVRRRGGAAAPRLAVLVMSLSAAAFAVTVLERFL